MRLTPTLFVLAVSLATRPLFSATPDSTDPAARLAEAQRLAESVHYRTGEIVLKGDIAKVKLPAGYNYLDPADSGIILTQLWHNPAQKDVLGMITPEGFDPLRHDSWAVILTYAEDGYV
ncbi:MAG TPA: DUF2167 domain-containing protein, partial [Opitutaceae bacterium]